MSTKEPTRSEQVAKAEEGTDSRVNHPSSSSGSRVESRDRNSEGADRTSNP